LNELIRINCFCFCHIGDDGPFQVQIFLLRPSSMAGFFRRKWRNDTDKTQSPSPAPSPARTHGRLSTSSRVVVSGPMSLSASRHGRRESDPSPGEGEIDEVSSVSCFGSACRQIRRLAFGSHLPCYRISATVCSARMW